MAASENARDAEHLTGFDCARCGHAAGAHYRNPGCRSCRCNLDPLCWCGDLSSKHETGGAS